MVQRIGLKRTGGSKPQFFITYGGGSFDEATFGGIEVTGSDGALCLDIKVSSVPFKTVTPFEGRVLINPATGEISWPEDIPTQLMAALSVVIGILLHGRDAENAFGEFDLDFIRRKANLKFPWMKLEPPRTRPDEHGVLVEGLDGRRIVVFPGKTDDGRDYEWPLDEVLKLLNRR